MTDPMMKARPPRKNSSSKTSTAATTFSTRPVIEIAFGVRRDSIRRLRATSRISTTRSPVRVRGSIVLKRAPRGSPVRNAQASGRARASAPLAASAEIAGDESAEEGVEPPVVAGHHDGDRHEQRDRRRRTRG